MQSRDAVHRVAAHGREVRHAHAFVAGLIDRTPLSHIGEEAAIDLVDDLQRARQEVTEERQTPGLERFREQGVIGVGERTPRQIPGLVPWQHAFIHQQPHELRHGDGWMGIIQLYRDHFGQSLDRFALELQQAQYVLQRAGDEKVLLREAQPLARFRLVVRIQNLGQGFRCHFLAYRAVIVTGVEVLEIEGLYGFALPQAQRVAGVDPEAERRNVTGDALHASRRNPSHPIAPLRVRVGLRATTEGYIRGDIVVDDLPRVAHLQPLVGDLDLSAVAKLLLEHAEFVVDTVTDRRYLERRQRIETAGREPSQAAVAETGLGLEREQRIEILVERRHGLAGVGLNAEVDEVVAELRADEELRRQVDRDLHLPLFVGAHRTLHARQHTVAHAVRQRHVPIVR